MDEENKAEGASEEVVNEGQESAVEPKVYDEAFVQKLLTEKKNYATKAREEELKRERIENESLLEQNKYKELWEKQVKINEELNDKYNRKDEVIKRSAKTNALQTELRKIGCKEDRIDRAMKFANLDQVDFDDETSTVTGVTIMAQSLRDEIPEFFKGASVGVNQQSAPVHDTALTLEAWKKLPYDERKKRETELYKNLGHQRS